MDIESSANTVELRRYTDILSVMDMILRKHLVLLSPTKWDDQNDTYFLRAYATRRNIAGVVALCLADTRETYHHWRIFSHGLGGACVVFKRDEFLDYIDAVPDVTCRRVEYFKISELAAMKPLATENLPFYKRDAFRAESEYRLICDSNAKAQRTFAIPIDLRLIDRIVLSPWTPKELFRSTRTLLRQINGCANIRVLRSSLIDTQPWQASVDDIDEFTVEELL